VLRFVNFRRAAFDLTPRDQDLALAGSAENAIAQAGRSASRQLRRGRFRLRCSNGERTVAYMKPIQAVCDKCKKTVEAKPLLSENELWLALNRGDEIEVMHLADDVHHTWKLTGQDKENLRKARAAGTA
jgi:hypothetical protein